MQLSSESPRVRWLAMVAVWILGAILLFWHADVVSGYLKTTSSLGLRGAPEAATPLQQTFPAFAADAQVWVRHALALLEGEGPRLRYTSIDNAPDGREVHWNTAWAWTIAGFGWMDHWLTGRPLPQAVEGVTLWLPSFTLMVLMIIMSAWAARRGGALLGVVIAVAMVGHPRVYEGFFPSYVDHHGLLTVSVLGTVLGAALMGAGWWRATPAGAFSILPRSPEVARGAAAIAALWGAVGMWVSAASVIPPIAIVGLAGVLALVLQGRAARAHGDTFDGDTWRTWGRVGGAASFCFYLLEYFPNHLGLRMEPNNPFFAAAWWGGGELIAFLGEWWVGARDARPNWRRVGLAIGAVCLAPLIIAIGGTRVFVVIDPFLAQLHRQYIQEFLPLWRSIAGTGWKTFFSVVGAENIPLLVGVGVLIAQGRRASIVIWFSTLAAVIFTAMAWAQSRWLLNASGSQVALAGLLLCWLVGSQRNLIRWSVGIVAVSLLFLPSAVTRITGGLKDLRERRVSPKDAQAALWRDVAASIRQSQPQGPITLLTSPNSSTAVGYFGRFKTLGTLYWENSAGLKAAANILAARNLDEAAALVKKHGVTHIAVISEEHFIDSYFRLLHPGATDDEVKKSFGLQILIDRSIPTWLRMIPYKAPDDLAQLNVNVMLFKVAFEQTPADALYHVALAKIATGSIAEAEQDIDRLIRDSAESFQPWLRKGELLFAREDWGGAATATITGIKKAPGSERLGLFASAAGAFFRAGRPAEAIRVYREALQETFNSQIAAYLAFVLATSKDDTIRNGREAQLLAEAAQKAEPNSPTVLNSLAAALAENGDFDQAIVVANRALANAKLAGDTPALQVTEQRLAAYRARKPWRQ